MFEENSKKSSQNSVKLQENKKRKVQKNIGKPGSSEKTVKKQYVSRRSEIYGIVIMLVSVLFFLSFFSFGRPGIITNYINNFLSYIFGITKYFFAFLLFVWGISFFIRRVKYLPSRFAWGFFLVYIAISGIISNNFKYANVFDPLVVNTRGGIIGAGVFYGLYKLVGKAGAITILSVFIIIGILIITRLSIIDISRRLSQRRQGAGKEIIDSKGNVIFRDNSIAGPLDERAKGKSPSRQHNGLKSYPEESRMPRIISYEEKQPGKNDAAQPGSRIFNAEKALYQGGTKQDTKYTGAQSEPVSSKIKIQGQSQEAGRGSTLSKDLANQLKIPLTDDVEMDASYRLPPVSILHKSEVLSPRLYKQNVAESVNTLNQLFYYFNLPAKITSVTRGPSITLYEVTLSQGVKVSKLLSLEDDFCVALGSPDLRFLTPIPGKSAIGIEVPNKIRSLVTLGDIFQSEDKAMQDLLTIPLGKNFSGEIVHMTINNMPHILIAGATNSGKSVCLNALIISLLMKVKPGQVKFIMIDPKMVELSMYNGIPHLLAPVIVDPRKAATVLSWVLEEMKNRLQMLLDYNCKNLEEFNFMAKRDATKDSDLKPIPYILVIIDELADLMMVAAAEVEDSICRIAQMARAVGIHLIISTQKPIVKIITGLIKTNVPARIAFKVTDYTDSRVILEHAGAEKLIGKGDMLFLSPNSNRPERLQGAFVTTKEISLITNYIKNQGKAEYNREITERFVKKEERMLEDDDLLYDALKVVVEIGHASASLLQRKLRLGYSRAARIIDQLEDKGFVGGYDGSKPREVLVSKEEVEDMLGGR